LRAGLPMITLSSTSQSVLSEPSGMRTASFGPQIALVPS
jgi:hypothetical protein